MMNIALQSFYLVIGQTWLLVQNNYLYPHVMSAQPYNLLLSLESNSKDMFIKNDLI